MGGAAAEAHDLERALAGRTPLVYGLVLTVGFLLLLLVVRAPLAAAVAVSMNLLATAAAFGVARLIFQDGAGEALLGFESQGFVDAWAPVFFFCLIFALAMDYSVFLLATAREQFERTGDARDGARRGTRPVGRVINAAGAVMVVVFFTFALSGPLPPKEMGVILGVAVLLDTLLVRLLLLPAALRLLGRRAWWVPRPLERLLPAVACATDPAACRQLDRDPSCRSGWSRGPRRDPPARRVRRRRRLAPDPGRRLAAAPGRRPRQAARARRRAPARARPGTGGALAAARRPTPPRPTCTRPRATRGARWATAARWSCAAGWCSSRPAPR